MRFFAKFGGRRRRNEKRYRRYCFIAEGYQDWSFERIIYHDCPLFTTRRNIDEFCIGTSPGEMCDFSPSSAVDVVETKSGIGDIVSARRLSRLVFRADCLARLFVVHNTSKY